jgi:hypothetical protein
MEGFSMPWFTKRTAGAACQAPPHKPTESLLRRMWDHRSLGSLLRPQGLAPPNFYPSDPHDLCLWPTGMHNLRWAMPLRPVKPAIHIHAWSLLCQAMPLRPAKPATHRHSQSLLGDAPQACTGPDNLCQAAPLRPAQASMVSAGQAIHRHARSLLGTHP